MLRDFEVGPYQGWAEENLSNFEAATILSLPEDQSLGIRWSLVRSFVQLTMGRLGKV